MELVVLDNCFDPGHDVFCLFLDTKVFDAVSELRHELFRLTIQNEKLRQEGLHIQGSDSKAPEKSVCLCLHIHKS